MIEMLSEVLECAASVAVLIQVIVDIFNYALYIRKCNDKQHI